MVVEHVDDDLQLSSPAGNDVSDRTGEAGGASLVVVANRLPLHVETKEGVDSLIPSTGGLATALTAALQSRRGTWIGSAVAREIAGLPREYEGIGLAQVVLSPDEHEAFYLGFSNATLWPLYHDAVRTPTYERRWWHSYREVNRRFAEAAAEAAAEGATVWIHDYQLQLVPQMLRELRADLRIGFFLHIPFPPVELFMQLPWRREILAGMLGADLVGFQVPGAAHNFARLTHQLLGATGTDAQVEYKGRTIKVGAFPISIDSGWFAKRSVDPKVKERSVEIRRELGDPQVLLLGVDRLDYTKGIEQRIRAAAELYDDGTLRADRHTIVQIAVPSREEDTHYQDERRHLEEVVSKVNGEHADLGQPAVHYLYQSVKSDELVALYLAADVMMVTPLRDGMNLVAKEYVACRTDGTGRLVLSEFAGASSELTGAFLVNPHDIDGLKEIIREALTTSDEEARQRMNMMHKAVLDRDVNQWAEEFLAALEVPDEDSRRGRRPLRGRLKARR